MLNDISTSVPTWEKVASGLLKLFEGEVLAKRPVVQHFVFGELFQANWAPSRKTQLQAPSETFRTTTVGVGPSNGGMPPTRAPWASQGTGGVRNGGPMPPTKAPWAK